MQGHQKINAFFPADIGSMLRGLARARPDLNEAWAILAMQVGFDDPESELGIGRVVIIQDDLRLREAGTDLKFRECGLVT